MTRAERALRILEEIVEGEEAANRYDVQSLRSWEHVVDATPCPTYPRIVLHVAMLYPPFWEQLALYGKKTALQRRNVKAHHSYAVRYEGVLLPLTRDQALELLKTRALPAGVALPQPVAASTYGNPEDPFEGLVDEPYIGALLGPAMRERRREGERMAQS